MAVCDKFWLFWVIFGWLWIHVGGCGCFFGWLWVVVGGCGWFRIVVDGLERLCMVMDGCGWLWLVAYFSITQIFMDTQYRNNTPN